MYSLLLAESVRLFIRLFQVQKANRRNPALNCFTLQHLQFRAFPYSNETLLAKSNYAAGFNVSRYAVGVQCLERLVEQFCG